MKTQKTTRKLTNREMKLNLIMQLVVGFCLLTFPATETSADRPQVIVKADNIKSSDGLEWEYVEKGLAVGDKVYVDRDYVYIEIPQEFVGMPYMRPANNSKLVEDLEVTFEIDRPAYVYLFWYPPIKLKEWLQEGFEMVMEKAVVVEDRELNVWKSKEPFKDKVILGHSGDSQGLYSGVVLEAAELAAVQPEGKLSTTWAHVKQIR